MTRVFEDELIDRYAKHLLDIYDKETAGGIYTFIGVLAQFTRDLDSGRADAAEEKRKYEHTHGVWGTAKLVNHLVTDHQELRPVRYGDPDLEELHREAHANGKTHS